MSSPITVTQPFLPPLEEFQPYLEEIWKSKWLTNMGAYHHELEQALQGYFGVEHLSLFANGTIALVTALQTLRISGEVITTPFSFVATAHSLLWNNLKPVFVDIDPDSLNLDPAKIERAITPQTTAILPVHVYGRPCDDRSIQEIADIYGLKVIYDAAHAFGVTMGRRSVVTLGDLSVLSFHATKVFNTFEGGAMVCPDAVTKKRVDFLKNFGFADEVTVMAPGINGKMNELQAAFGLLHLRYMPNVLELRKKIDQRYRAGLDSVKGIRVLPLPQKAKHNFAYFPIFVEPHYPLTRDALYEKLRESGIYSRRYFYPLISDFPMYRGLPSAEPENLPIAHRASRQVICLPIYPALQEDDVDRIIELLQ